MTKVICFINNGNIYFDCFGHSDFKNPNTDNNDVCVAVSAICGMLVRYAASKGISPKICKDGHILFNTSVQGKKIVGAFEAAVIEMQALQDEYPEHVKVY